MTQIDQSQYITSVGQKSQNEPKALYRKAKIGSSYLPLFCDEDHCSKIKEDRSNRILCLQMVNNKGTPILVAFE
jgi:hypothetical protein